MESTFGIWELPEEWRWIALGEVCDIAIGGTPRRGREEYWGPGNLWISIGDLNGRIVQESKETITNLGVINSNVKIVEPGTVLMSFKLTIGKMGIAGKRLYTNEAIAALPIKSSWKEKLDRDYLFHVLHTVPLTEEVDVAVKGKTLNKKKLARILIPLPEIHVQRRLVAYIDKLLTEVSEARLILQAMRHDVSQLLPSAIGQILLERQYDLNYVPLREVAEAFNGRASGQGESSVRVFKTKHVYPHKLRLDRPSYMKSDQVDKLPENRLLRSGDVLMANIAEGTLGRVSYVEETEGNWTTDTQVMILRSRSVQRELVGKWLYYYLWSEAGQREILQRRTGIAFADKRGQTHIYPKNVLDLPVPLPKSHQRSSVECQREIVERLDTFQSETDQMQIALDEKERWLDKLEKSVRDRAFRGQL